MKHKSVSIKWKIFAYLLGFTFILIGILWLFQIVYLDRFYKAIKTREAEKVTQQVTEILKANVSDMEDCIDELASDNNLSILVTDTDANTLYRCEYLGNAKMDAIPSEEILKYYEQAKDEGGSTKIEYRGNRDRDFNMLKPKELPDDQSIKSNHGMDMAESVIYVNVLENKKSSYVIFVNSMLTPVGATVHTLQIQLVCITVILIALALILATIMSKRISKSIILVNDSAKKLAKGEYDVTFNGNDYKEIGELSDTLNFAAKELEKTESLRRELIANVSHDLRTPLTMIIAYSEVMRDLPGENSPENIQVIIDESKRLTNLVNDMLDISKLQSGVMEKNSKEYNLTESIHSVMERYNKLKEQEGYDISFVYDKEVMVDADEYKIYQVIYNLVNNAINYTGDKKDVIVKQTVEQNYVKIEVTDSGEGIRKEDLPYVWDRYYKVDKTHKRAITGTGLGLSIVKNILELHEAEFGVESEVGSGSTFWFKLNRII